MIFFSIGIDYRRAPLEQREAAYRSRGEIIDYWRRVGFGRAAVLTTCNRIEVYRTAKSLDEAVALQEAFRYRFKDYFKDAYVRYGDQEVLKHGLRLACGLESQLKGEYQIIQQLERWSSQKGFPKPLKSLWSRIIKDAKKIRGEAGLNDETVNIAGLLFSDLKEHITFSEETKIVVIGTGKVAELIAQKRPELGCFIFVARKRRSKARRLARLAGGEALLPEEISERLITADAIVCATSSPHYVLSLRNFNKALKRRNRPLYIYDLAIPRRIPFINVKDLDDLILKHSRDKNFTELLSRAEELIEKKVFKYKESIDVCNYTNRYASQPACYQAG
jgi:glutamyl-tRNA reductase